MSNFFSTRLSLHDGENHIAYTKAIELAYDSDGIISSNGRKGIDKVISALTECALHEVKGGYLHGIAPYPKNIYTAIEEGKLLYLAVFQCAKPQNETLDLIRRNQSMCSPPIGEQVESTFVPLSSDEGKRLFAENVERYKLTIGE